MPKPNPIAAAMALAFDVMEDTDVPKRLRDRAKDLFAEHAPEVLDPGFDFMRALLNTAEKRMGSIKPSDLKPAPANGKLERNTKHNAADDANALEWLSKAEFLTDEAKRSFQQGNMTAYRQLLGGASTAMERAIGAMSADDTAAISDIFTASVRAEEAGEAPVDRSKAYTSYPRLPTVAVFATRIFEQDGNTYIVRDIVDDEGRIRNQVGITKEGGSTITWVNQRDGSPMTMPVVPQVLASPCKCGAVT